MCQGRSQGHLKLTQYNIYITVYPKGRQTSNEVNWNLILINIFKKVSRYWYLDSKKLNRLKIADIWSLDILENFKKFA